MRNKNKQINENQRSLYSTTVKAIHVYSVIDICTKFVGEIDPRTRKQFHYVIDLIPFQEKDRNKNMTIANKHWHMTIPALFKRLLDGTFINKCQKH